MRFGSQNLIDRIKLLEQDIYLRQNKGKSRRRHSLQISYRNMFIMIIMRV